MSVVHWTAPAIEDLQVIDDHWSSYSIEAASDMANRIEQAAMFLIDFPRAGPEINGSPVRKWRVQATRNYLLYRLGSDGPQILRVRHDRQGRADP